jgi:8-oxo-dGTP diphosphatase|tara:strand:+ start:315 stop:719 length:405 start_codon:yes stop_codon:yes gene_type:complete
MKSLFENWRGYMGEAKDSDSVSKAVIIKEDGALLLLRSAEEKFPHKWDLPGGHIHVGEDPKDGLIREVKEETGVTLTEPIEKLYEEDNITFYKAQMPPGEITLSHEHEEHKFVTRENIPDNMSGKFKRAIKKAL